MWCWCRQWRAVRAPPPRRKGWSALMWLGLLLMSAGCLGGAIRPDGTNDMTQAVLTRVKSGATVELAEGEYHFYADQARPMQVYISNHDQPLPRKVQLSLCGVEKLTVRGLGAGAKLRAS